MQIIWFGIVKRWVIMFPNGWEMELLIMRIKVCAVMSAIQCYSSNNVWLCIWWGAGREMCASLTLPHPELLMTLYLTGIQSRGNRLNKIASWIIVPYLYSLEHILRALWKWCWPLLLLFLTGQWRKGRKKDNWPHSRMASAYLFIFCWCFTSSGCRETKPQCKVGQFSKNQMTFGKFWSLSFQ